MTVVMACPVQLRGHQLESSYGGLSFLNPTSLKSGKLALSFGEGTPTGEVDGKKT